MIEVKLNKDKFDAVNKMTVRLEKFIKKPVKALWQIGTLMVASIDKNFESEGRPEKWAPLSPMTIAMRRNKDKGSIKILQDTGHLRRSIIFDPSRNNNTAVAIGTNVKYGKQHQYGGKGVIPEHDENVRAHVRVLRNGKTSKVVSFTRHMPKRITVIPRRAFLMFQEEDMNDIQTVLIDSVKEQTKKQ